jgi:hypothetical protein
MAKISEFQNIEIRSLLRLQILLIFTLLSDTSGRPVTLRLKDVSGTRHWILFCRLEILKVRKQQRFIDCTQR